MSCSDIFLGVIAILFPPIAVWIKSGLCSADSLINILLCMLGYLPGLLHAWYIIAKYPEHDHDYEPIDAESGRQPSNQQRVTYYYVSRDQQQGGSNNARVVTAGGNGYGTAAGPRVPGNKPVGSSQQQQQSGVVRSGNNAGSSRAVAAAGEGGSSSDVAPPPSYNDAVRGDHKVQSQD